MKKTYKKPKTISSIKPIYALQPWVCQHYPDHSEIEAYVEATGDWEAVAEVHQTAGHSAEALADYIVRVINDNQKNKNLLLDAMEALQLCLEEDGLTFSSEQAVDRVFTRIKTKVE